LLCVACSLDASPKLQANASDDEGHKKNGLGGWMPPGIDDPRASSSSGGAAMDAGAGGLEEEEVQDAAKPASGTKKMDSGATHPAANNTPPASMQLPAAPAAGSGAAPVPSADMNTNPAMSAAGSGGVAGDQAGAAGDVGNAGSAGGESDNARQRLIDAAIEALGGGNGDEPWRNGGRDGGRLSADFVMSVLFSMRTSGVCFRDVRRCVEICVTIAQDCQPCAEDLECAQALMDVCGETLGTCRIP
jgi:hypothetical protein